MEMEIMTAETILAQLGGDKFRAMTGAKDFVYDKDSLSFALPRAKSGINKIKVALADNDTYTLTAYKVARPTARNGWRFDCKTVAEHVDVYADSLRSFFTSATGLDTSL